MRNETRPPLIVITGATATGKTAASIQLARHVGGEIVSADSRQVYRGLDIGTAKPTPAERQGVPHHLVDIIEPDQPFSLATYQTLALEAIASIHARGRVPLLVGGTPLYVNAVSAGWALPQAPPDPAFRASLEREIVVKGVAAVASRLVAVDPQAAARAGHNARRIIRALEILHVTGETATARASPHAPPFRLLRLVLTLPRPQLHARVDARVDAMVRAGLVAEVETLLKRGYASTLPALSAIGYAEIASYLAGNESLESAIARIKTNTHRYVRHQETWLRRDREALRLDPDDPAFEAELRRAADRFLADRENSEP